MKIRLMGTPAECQAAVKALEYADRAGLLVLLEWSDPYPNRGDSRQVRVYVEAHPAERGRADHRTG